MKLTNKIGVIVDSFRLPVREGLLKAQAVGAEGVQIYADDIRQAVRFIQRYR